MVGGGGLQGSGKWRALIGTVMTVRCNRDSLDAILQAEVRGF